MVKTDNSLNDGNRIIFFQIQGRQEKSTNHQLQNDRCIVVIKLQIKDIKLKQVQKFNYLGRVIRNDGEYNTER